MSGELTPIRFRVTNISPLLMHSPQAMRNAGTGMNRKRIPSPEEEAEAGTYRLPSRQLYLPTTAFRSALIDASTGRRLGKTSAPRLFAAALFVQAPHTPLVHPTTGAPLAEYAIDVQRVVVQNAGVLRARPRLDAWAGEVAFEYDADFLTPEVIEEAFGLAGRLVGVGDYRPRCPKGKGGPYGRFTVEALAA
jgi:hypothetical protein